MRNRVGHGECNFWLLTLLPLPFTTTICILDKLHILALACERCEHVKGSEEVGARIARI